jgi:eukaryotic-like serine/threonine-protein kinase
MTRKLMSLQIGQQLGSYEITALLGKGGMGEVYRAHDSKLGREVAIKVLPDIFASDGDRLARFEREAHLLASLNHSNIAAIYDLAESNGTRFLVLELVLGETLAATIERGPAPIDEAIAICRQIAEGLEAAHEKGIIHRDLKPANVKITPHGKVKILDFGLGKLMEDERPISTLSQSPTLTGRGTAEGIILGTAAYMSPEQARGKEVDKRADIWSFGCVMFELFTRKQTFGGETVTDLFASILKGEPDWNALPASTPQSLRALLLQCLQKDPRRRLRDIGDARIALEDAATRPESAGLAEAAVARPVRSSIWIAAAVILLVVTLGLALVLAFRSPSKPDMVQFIVYPPEKGMFTSGGSGRLAGFTLPSVSPDGRHLAYTASMASGEVFLWVRSIAAAAPERVNGTQGAILPFWSPDSRTVAFFSGRKLKKVDVAGGPPQDVCDVPGGGRAGTWSRDGEILISTGVGTIARVSPASGEIVQVNLLSAGQTIVRFPSFLPDGRHFLYAASGAPEVAGTFVGTLDTRDSKRLLNADTGAVYSPSGDLLFVRQNVLFRQPFDTATLELTGDPVPVAEQVLSDVSGLGAFSVSETGVLAYQTSVRDQDLQLVWVDRSGKLIGPVASPGTYRGLDLSPDGKRVAVHRHDGNGGDIWIFDSTGGPMQRVTFDASLENSSPVWSPDGSRLAFASRRNGKSGLYQTFLNGGREALLFESDVNSVPMAWSPDDKSILFWVTGSDVWILPLGGDKKPFSMLGSPALEAFPQISQDGKWVAYASDRTGEFEIYVQLFPSGGAMRQLSVNGGHLPRWRRDGKELFYTSPSGALVSVKVNATGSSLNYEAPEVLFNSRVVGLQHRSPAHPYAVSPDGQRFLIPRPAAALIGEETSSLVTVTVNWASSVKVPKR